VHVDPDKQIHLDMDTLVSFVIQSGPCCVMLILHRNCTIYIKKMAEQKQVMGTSYDHSCKLIYLLGQSFTKNSHNKLFGMQITFIKY